MNIDVKQLEINVNLHSRKPDFLNYELHYVIASDENTFRFVEWNESPNNNERKFYCFRMDKSLSIPTGNISLDENYLLKEDPVYPLLTNYSDFIPIIETLGRSGVAKGIKQFSNEEIDAIKNDLERKYGAIEKHTVTSNEAQHLILVLNNVEISISATMVYFRPKAPFAEEHYSDVKE